MHSLSGSFAGSVGLFLSPRVLFSEVEPLLIEIPIFSEEQRPGLGKERPAQWESRYRIVRGARHIEEIVPTQRETIVTMYLSVRNNATAVFPLFLASGTMGNDFHNVLGNPCAA